jgi:DNA-binding MarR family transcriptional regulator
MPIIKNHYINEPYTIIHNSVVNDTKLSFKALGLYLYLRSKPESWKFTEEQLAKQHKEGVTAIRSAIKELQEAGYLKREFNYQEIKGREVIYHIYETSSLENLS